MAEKKKYVEANLPLINSESRILGSPEELDGKTIKLDLTRKLRGKGLTVTFHIFNQDKKLVGVPKKLELVKTFIQRMLRKRIDYVEDSFTAQSADLKVTVKPFLITRKKVSRAVRRNLRNTAKEFLTEYIKEREYNELCKEIVSGTLQKTLLPKLKKVYPLSFCDLRIFETKEIKKINLTKILEELKKIETIKEESADEENTENSDEETVVEESVKEKPIQKESVKEE